MNRVTHQPQSTAMLKRAAPSSSSSSHRPPWTDLPRDLTANILQRLAMNDIFQSAEVCSSWRSVCKDPSMWRFVDLGTIRIGIGRSCYWSKICRRIVNWSQGQLISIKIDSFATDDLLLYIAQRAQQLRSLSIWSDRISDEGFRKAVKEFPQLEMLELVNCNISKEAIEVAGHSCPLLKSFTFSKNTRFIQVPSDEEALAIALNMCGLKHLALVRNAITDEGVKAILDGCPGLESLDLENCNHVRLDGELRNRCSQQIKDLNHSIDPTFLYDGQLFDRDYLHFVNRIMFGVNWDQPLNWL